MVAWNEEVEGLTIREKFAVYVYNNHKIRRTKILFIICIRFGFTNSLYQKVAVNGTLNIVYIVERPYKGLYDIRSYSTVILFVGNIGITYQLPYIRDLVVGFTNKTVVIKKIILIWNI